MRVHLCVSVSEYERVNERERERYTGFESEIEKMFYQSPIFRKHSISSYISIP